ncbi:RalA-binding protein 1 [Orchesella cincta]|uniref:RalA-binding protein 1 n=1 Tax=Orchesella cincta TaxID=48709 RepID=A0A1D2ML81_ORCCI|nr:RalA-binding protein 1 [Orchesella cincta]
MYDTDEGDKKKKKEKKDSKKDKGYSALAGESSHDEDETNDSKSPGKGIKIKAFSKLSGKKKDKDKKTDKGEKDLKKAEKEAKEKRKSEEKERKSLEKELHITPGPSVPRPQIPFSGAHLMKSNSLNHSASVTPQSSFDAGTPVAKRSLIISGESEKESTPSKPPKEKSAAFNVFLNAPAPLLSKLKDKDSKDKESKKEHKDKGKDKEKKHKDKGDKDKSKKDREHKEKDKKDHASGMAKVKLKLMRSKNSLEDVGDVPHITSHQFPEDPDALAKEIKKYEGLLESAHTSLKSSKKISKKQEEQLWELQRTLTQLKRKLRSINALSSATAYHIHAHAHPPSAEKAPAEQTFSPPPPPPSFPVFKKCDSIDGHRVPKPTTITEPVKPVLPEVVKKVVLEKDHEAITVLPASQPIEIPKIPMPPSKNSHKLESVAVSPPTGPTLATSPQQNSVIEAVPLRTHSTNSRDIEALSPVDSEMNLSDSKPAASNYNFASPRPSIDIVAQVHRSSSAKSEEDEVCDLDADDSLVNQPNIDDESLDDRQSPISNISSHDSKDNIEAVLDDANKMIGSMHEEIMFDGPVEIPPAVESRKSVDRLKLNASSNPIIAQDDSDVELFTNDLELDPEANLPTEEPCPDPFAMPVFDTAEYLNIENEALSVFCEQLREEAYSGQTELKEMIQMSVAKPQNNVDSSESSGTTLVQKDDDFSDLLVIRTQLKSENEALWDNVNRLRLAIASCKVDEFRLVTRLKYLETKTSALSPVTITTPLQTEG